VNQVRIETKNNVAPSATGVDIGVFVDNDKPLTGVTFAFEVRSYSGGAYMASGSFTRAMTATGRMLNSPLGNENNPGNPDGWPAASVTNRSFASLTATTSGCNRAFFQHDGSQQWTTATAQPDFVSPDAFMLATVSQGDPGIGEAIEMPAGSDGTTPSYHIVCNVGAAQGIFVIDTTCVAPAVHLAFVWNDAGTATTLTPEFVPGYVGVGVVAGVKDVETGGQVPTSYSLDQNYPNPFNAGTNIQFTTIADGRVTLDVYNVLGQKVRNLVDQQMSSGTHEADWDGRDGNGNVLSTGVYFYRIQARGFTSTRKMVMIK
jgi:hypothetical protein